MFCLGILSLRINERIMNDAMFENDNALKFLSLKIFDIKKPHDW